MPRRMPLVLVGLTVVALATWRSVVTLQHSASPVYDLPTQAVVVVLVAAAASVLAALLLVFLGRPTIALPAFLVAAAVTLSFLVFPTLGLLLLAVTAVLTLRSNRFTSQRRTIPSIGAASSLAMAVVVLLIASNQRPIVQCLSGGVATNGPGLFSGGGGSVAGSSSTRPDGRTHGTVSFDTRTYHFACNGTRLVSFHKG